MINKNGNIPNIPLQISDFSNITQFQRALFQSISLHDTR